MQTDTQVSDFGAALDAAKQSRGLGTGGAATQTTPPVDTTSAPKGEQGNPPDTKGEGAAPKDGQVPPPATGDKKDTPKETTAGPDDKDKDEKRRADNRYYAQRRIAQREERRRRLEEKRQRLQEERDRYADKEGPDFNETMVKVKDDQLAELQRESQEEAQLEWESEAHEIFGEDAESFIRDSKYFANWINTKEPELQAWIDKPYGKHLLKGWMDKVAKVPENANKWESMNSYEKSQMLAKYYSELQKFAKDYAAGRIDENGNPVQKQDTPPSAGGQPQPKQDTPPQQTPPPNVPVPGSGRTNTQVSGPTDNFGIALANAKAKRGLN